MRSITLGCRTAVLGRSRVSRMFGGKYTGFHCFLMSSFRLKIGKNSMMEKGELSAKQEKEAKVVVDSKLTHDIPHEDAVPAESLSKN